MTARLLLTEFGRSGAQFLFILPSLLSSTAQRDAIPSGH